jgi:transcription elongation factor Elf1
MSPRKSHEGKVPKWAYSMHKQQAKKLVQGPFECPSCARKSLVIIIEKNNNRVVGVCGCGFKASVTYVPSFQPLDYYNKLLDQTRKTKTD